MNDDAPPLILHVIHHLVTGGMENGLVSLINGMPETLFRHAVVCIEDYSEFRQRLTRPDTEVIALHRGRIGIWRLRYQLYRHCRRLRPAIVHSRNQSGLDALLPARLAGVRHCIHGEHGWDVHDLEGKNVKQQLLRRIHSPLIDRYITVSRDLKSYLVERVKVRSNRITTICNGVDTERFKPAVRKSVGVLPAGFSGEDSLVIGTVGRIQPVKDQETLLRAFAAAQQDNVVRGSRLRLVIVGDGPLLARLTALAESLGIAEKTWFAGDRSDVAELLSGFDLFVLPSLAEGISNTILEAMASGLPVLATAIGGNPELVQDGINGRLFTPRDAASLASLFAEYFDDPSMRETHGMKARQLAVENFSLKAMLETYQLAYQGLLQQP